MPLGRLLYESRQGSAGSLPQVRPLPPPVWSLMRTPGDPTADVIDRDHRACSKRSTQGKLPTPLTAHAPQCRRRRASASWPQPGRAHQTACRPDLESLFPRTPRRSSPSHTCPVSTPLTRQLQLCYLSFNGRRPPDAPLFQPQLIGALPFFFQRPSVCVSCLCHMSKAWRTTCLSLRACSLGWSSLSGLRTWSRGSSR